MNDTTEVALRTIHDTVHYTVATGQGLSIEQMVKYFLALVAALGSIGGVWRYLFHHRLKANEKAAVSTLIAQSDAAVKMSEAQQEADAAVVEATAKKDVAVQHSTITALDFWESKVLSLNELYTTAQAALAVLQSQAAASEKEKGIAEGRLQVAEEKIAHLKDVIAELREQINSNKEELAELPALRNQVQSLIARCELLQLELDETKKK
jgi:hypothetical protein